MERKINFSKLKVGVSVQVVKRNNYYGWMPEMEDSLGKYFLIRNIQFPDSYGSGSKGTITLSNGYNYPFDCFDGKFKKVKESKWKKYWKNN